MAGSRTPRWAWRPAWLWKALAVSVGLGAFVAGLVVVGRLAWKDLRHQQRYTVAFTEIDCTPPPGQTREDFLDEVRYLAAAAPRLRLLDPDLGDRLAHAFARHPRVEKVVRVELVPPRQIHVELAYRTPVLAVRLAGGSRAVDAAGILLPKTTPVQGLPVLQGPVAGPRRADGRPWGDPLVEGAARTAAYLRPEQGRLHLLRVANEPGGLVWQTLAGTRVLWGRPVGDAAVNEAPAEVKRARLLNYCDEYGGLDYPTGRQEHDVRPPDRPRHRALDPY